jgi:hypothetical protein
MMVMSANIIRRNRFGEFYCIWYAGKTKNGTKILRQEAVTILKQMNLRNKLKTLFINQVIRKI